MASEFSNDRKYFASIDTNGKLKVWETNTSILKNTFTPNLQIKASFTCLHWIEISGSESPWRKRKRHNEKESTSNQLIALGTSSGSIILYSPFESAIRTTLGIDSSNKSGATISCLSWTENVGLVSCADSSVVRWNIADGSIKSTWKVSTSNEKISSVLILSEELRLVTASRNIKLWDIETQTLLRTYTGHSSEINILKYVPSTNFGYIISSAKADTLLSCWTLHEISREKNSIASFLMEDVAKSISLTVNKNGVMNMAAVVRSGVVHCFQQTLNGKCERPIKPKVTLQVASETDQNKEMSVPIPIITASLNEDITIQIGFGALHALVFDTVKLAIEKKIQYIVKVDPRKIVQSKNIASKTLTPVSTNVEYLTPANTSVVSTKRKAGGEKFEVSMEQRLENLVIDKSEIQGSVPKSDNMANLLIQGLHSKDKNILKDVFSKLDETFIRNTVRRLPLAAIPLLVKELNILIQAKTMSSRIGAVWMKHLVQAHAGQLISNPSLNEMVGPTLGVIQNRLSLLAPLSRLRGRLDLLISQISASNEEESNSYQPLLVFQDNSSESESEDNLDDLLAQSDSDDQWEENASNSDINEKNDVEMLSD